MRLVDHYVGLSADDLITNSDFDRDTLENAIRNLDSRDPRLVVWDRREGLIRDERIRQSRLHIKTCRSTPGTSTTKRSP